MFPAATKNGLHTCPLSDGPNPHIGFEIIEGDSTVYIENQAAATQGHALRCNSPSVPTIQTGSTTVFIGGKPAARQNDLTSHGGVIVKGVNTVFIGG